VGRWPRKCRQSHAGCRAPSAGVCRSAPRYRRVSPAGRPWPHPGTRVLSAYPRCCRQALRAPGRRSFFKSCFGLRILLRMHRTRLQPRQAEFAEPGADRALMHLDRPAARHFRPQIRAPPAHDFMHPRIRSLDYQIAQLRLLRRGQKGFPARAFAGLQPIDPVRVIAVHPVAQCLAVHTVERRSLGPGPAFQHQCKSQDTANLSAIRASRRSHAKLRRRQVATCNPNRCAHAHNSRPRIAILRYRVRVQAKEEPP